MSRTSSFALALTAYACAVCSTIAAPLPTTNQNPFLAAAAIPNPLPARLAAGETLFAATLNWGSTAIIDSDADEILIVDGETRELRITATHAYDNGFAVRFELPYLHTGPGSLDGFIDDFHDAFGFSEGDRPLFARNQMTLWYLRSGEPSVVNRTSRTSGLGDLTIALGKQLSSQDRSAVAAWLSIAAPTAASGAYIAEGDDWKLSATLNAQHRFGARWLAHAQGSVTSHTGDGILDRQKSLVWSGIAGVQFAATPSISLDVQLQAHTAPIKGADLDFLRDAVIFTVGGAVQVSDRTSVHLGVSEDIQVEASPDAVFVFGVTTSWREGRSR